MKFIKIAGNAKWEDGPYGLFSGRTASGVISIWTQNKDSEEYLTSPWEKMPLWWIGA